MANTRVSQEHVKVLRVGDPRTQVSQEHVKVLRVGDPHTRVSQQHVKVLLALLPQVPIDPYFIDASPVSITIGWNHPFIGAASYEVRVDAGAPVNVGLVDQAEVEGLAPGTEYVIGVRSITTEGTASAWVTVTAETMDFAVENLGVYPDITAVNAEWDAHILADSYQVRLDSGEIIDTEGATTFRWDELAPEHDHSVEVRAYFGETFSPWALVETSTLAPVQLSAGAEPAGAPGVRRFSIRRLGWRYLAQRLDGNGVGGQFIDVDLPLQNVSFTDVLSGPTQITGQLSPKMLRLVDSDGRPSLRKWETAIYAECDGVIRAGGILTAPDFAGPAMTVSCTGFSGYPKDMPYVDSYSAVQIDPMDVVRHIWEHLQDQDNGDLGMQVSLETSPVRIGTELKVVSFDPADDPDKGPISFEAGPVRLAWWQTDDLGEYIDQLASSTPFDYHERHEWVGDEIHHFLDMKYPRLGRRRNDLRFVIGENIAQIPRVGVGDYATGVMALGQGEGPAMKMALVNRPNSGLRRVNVVVDKSRRSLASVDSLAKSELQYLTGADDVTEFYVANHSHAPIGSVEVGDEILVEGDTGWRDIQIWSRVVAITINPQDSDTMRMAVIRSDKMS